MSHQPRTSIKDIPVANEKIYYEVGKLTRQRPSQVQSVLEFVGNYVGDLISKGEMEGVMLPYFGKFVPKTKWVHHYKKTIMRKRNGTDIIFKGIKGKPIQIKTPPDETIRSERGQNSSPEQGMDSDGAGVQGTADQG
jgi:hypothetical protein